MNRNSGARNALSGKFSAGGISLNHSEALDLLLSGAVLKVTAELTTGARFTATILKYGERSLDRGVFVVQVPQEVIGLWTLPLSVDRILTPNLLKPPTPVYKLPLEKVHRITVDQIIAAGIVAEPINGTSTQKRFVTYDQLFELVRVYGGVLLADGRKACYREMRTALGDPYDAMILGNRSYIAKDASEFGDADFCIIGLEVVGDIMYCAAAFEQAKLTA